MDKVSLLQKCLFFFKKKLKKLHIIHNIYIKYKFFIKKKSYSMNNEDIAVLEYFKDKKNGFYVDVGCYHPIHRNNTFLLHKKGWNGINIDIHEFSIDLFNYLRPKDFNYNLAISNKNDLTDMYFQKQLSQLSTIEKKQAKKNNLCACFGFLYCDFYFPDIVL